MLHVLCLRTHLSTKNVFMELIFVILVIHGHFAVQWYHFCYLNRKLFFFEFHEASPAKTPAARGGFPSGAMKISITSEKYDLKIPTSFGETSFALRQNCWKFNKWHQTPHIFQIVHLPSIYVHIRNSKIKVGRKPSKLWVYHQSPPRRVENYPQIWWKMVEYYCC